MLLKLFKRTAGIIFGIKTIKKQAKWIANDLLHAGDTLAAAKLAVKAQGLCTDEWNSFVQQHGLTAENLKSQYTRRRIMAVLLLFTMLACLYSIVIIGHISNGLAALLVVSVIYFINIFRLYQIRHHRLCSVGQFLTHLKTSFREALPLPLPDEWQAIDKTLPGQIDRVGEAE